MKWFLWYFIGIFVLVRVFMVFFRFVSLFFIFGLCWVYFFVDMYVVILLGCLFIKMFFINFLIRVLFFFVLGKFVDLVGLLVWVLFEVVFVVIFCRLF